jgi:hypothetical protein
VVAVATVAGFVSARGTPSAGAAGTVRVSVGDVTIVEGNAGNRAALFPITLSEPATSAVSVSYTLAGDTATGGKLSATDTDFNNLNGVTKTLTFKPGISGKTPVEKFVAVTIKADTEVEGDQTFSLTLKNPSVGLVLDRDEGVGTIRNDDASSGASLSVSDGSIGEGDATKRVAKFSVTLSEPASTMVTATVQIVPVSATGGYKSGPIPPGTDVVDGLGATKTITFKPGLNGLTPVSKVFPVTVLTDTDHEGDQTFEVRLVGSIGASISDDTGVGTIIDDDPIAVTWAQIGAGRDHSCGLAAGAVYCWGLGADGELGNGTNMTSSAVPVPVTGLGSGVSQISVGDFHTCALSAGAVSCWGMNTVGQLGNGTTANSNVPVAVSGLGSGVTEVSAGYQHSCAVAAAGAVQCWGSNSSGQLGNGTGTNSNVPVGVTGLGTGGAQVSAGNRHSCAVTTAGGAWCWGRNVAGELGDGTSTNSSVPVAVSGLGSGVEQISAGGVFHSCAVTTAGGAWCWGDNTSGAVGDGSVTSSSVPVSVFGLGSGVAQISTGGFTDGVDVFANSCAVTTSGTASCWGSNSVGQLGDGGSEASSSVPVAVVSQSTAWSQLSMGFDHSCAVTTAGTAHCWGSSNFGMLGDGNVGGGSTPVTVVDP